jgi:hypothetical protein
MTRQVCSFTCSRPLRPRSSALHRSQHRATRDENTGEGRSIDLSRSKIEERRSRAGKCTSGCLFAEQRSKMLLSMSSVSCVCLPVNRSTNRSIQSIDLHKKTFDRTEAIGLFADPTMSTIESNCLPLPLKSRSNHLPSSSGRIKHSFTLF